MNNKIKTLEKEKNTLSEKNKDLVKEKNKLSNQKKKLEANLLTASQQINSNINNNINIKTQSINSIKESGIFFNDGQLKNEKNKSNNLAQSSNPYFNPLLNPNLGNSIMPFGDNPIYEKDEKEENSSGNASKKDSKNKNIDSSKNNNINDENLGMGYVDDDDENQIGMGYMDDDDEKKDEKIEKKEVSKSKKEKNNIKKSALKMSFNNNFFEFGGDKEKEEEFQKEMLFNNEYNELLKEKNDLDEKLQMSYADNEELKKMIEQKNKEIEDLKKTK